MEEKRTHRYINLKNGGMKILMVAVAALLLSMLLAGESGAQNAIVSKTEIRGDVNRNGRLDTGDATLILRNIVGLPIPSQYMPILPIGDMNCNERIDTGDATLVLRDIVGLPIPVCWGGLNIIGFTPRQTTVYDIVGAARTFSITVNQTVDVTWYINGTLVQTNMSVNKTDYTNTSAALGTWIVNATATNTNGTVSHGWTWNVTPPSELPPDPCTVAQPLDSSVATNLATSTEFLYTGSNPIQTGVAPDTIDAMRVAVLRGRVLTREGTPLSGMNISILAHPEFGRTMSRADGMFDMAVNGGGLLTVRYEKAGYLSAQRKVQTHWQDYAWLPDVVQIQADTKVTTIDLTSSAPIQMARGSQVKEFVGVGLPGWNITLINDTGGWIASTSTGADGFYQFTNLAPGRYTVIEETKAGWMPTNATFKMVVLNKNITNLNFTNLNLTNKRLFGTFSISGFKINDTNGNGKWDADEAGLPGWNITLINFNTSEVKNTSTDANGFYQFTNLVNGSYFMTEETKLGFTPTNGTFTNGTFYINIEGQNITNQNITNQNITNQHGAFSISGFKINDTNGNGKWEAGEAGLPGWNITLINGVAGAVFNTTTDANGFYQFTNLANGAYFMTEETKPGWKSTNGTYFNGTFYINIEDQNFTNQNFTNQRVLAKFNISGFKINDTNGNGAWDSDEIGLSGWNITLMNATGVNIGSTSTDANGFYQFTNLAPDIYILTEERRAGWISTSTISDVVALDNDITNLNFTNQIASGGPFTISGYKISDISEINGTRQATLLFPQGTQANMTLPNGTTQVLTTLHVHATEYTVGTSGPNAMPAELPPTSFYTYAVEFSVDEAVGDTEVRFNRPIPFYVENFLGFPVGEAVPVGYYNRSLGQWIASDNGLIIKILNITGGLADLDIDGSGLAANATALAALNITDAERQQLATLYKPGQSLWRMPITHFSWDSNWGVYPPKAASSPKQPPPNKPECKPCEEKDPIIGIQNQVLGEVVDIVGTPFNLHYSSDRVLGRKEAYTLDIPLSGASIPESVKRIDLEVMVSNRHFAKSFLAAPNQSYTFTWDGQDSCNRTLQGRQPVTVRIGYVYDGVYERVERFGYNGNGIPISGNRARQEITLWQEWHGLIGPWDARGQGMGG